jgi:hypothetical protein
MGNAVRVLPPTIYEVATSSFEECLVSVHMRKGLPEGALSVMKGRDEIYYISQLLKMKDPCLFDNLSR